MEIKYLKKFAGSFLFLTFAIATSVYGNYFKSNLFGGDGSSTTLTDVAVCIKSPLHFFTFQFCDK